MTSLDPVAIINKLNDHLKYYEITICKFATEKLQVSKDVLKDLIEQTSILQYDFLHPTKKALLQKIKLWLDENEQHKLNEKRINTFDLVAKIETTLNDIQMSTMEFAEKHIRIQYHVLTKLLNNPIAYDELNHQQKLNYNLMLVWYESFNDQPETDNNHKFNELCSIGMDITPASR
jgi:hypothetical protein